MHDSYIRIAKVARGDLVLRISPPLEIQYGYSDEYAKLVTAHEPVFDMHLCGSSAAEIRAEAADEIVFLWKEFAERTDERFSDGALQLREKLKARITKTQGNGGSDAKRSTIDGSEA